MASCSSSAAVQMRAWESEECPTPAKKAKIHDLVQIIITDPFLLNNWAQFSGGLECPAQDEVRWIRGIKNDTFSFYQVFSEILKNWTDRNPNKTVYDLHQVLWKMKFVAVAEKLEEKYGKESDLVIMQLLTVQKGRQSVNELIRSTGKEMKWPLTFGLFRTTKYFSGREKQLKQLKSYFDNPDENLVLISGLGGIGKTELCCKFTNDIPSLYDFMISRIWLHGETFETLRDSVLRLAQKFGVNESEGNPSVYFENLTSTILEYSSRLLVVIDNVDVTYDEVVKVIQLIKKNERMFVIVTSRNSWVLYGGGVTIQLDVLSKDEARFMLQKSMPGLADSDADKLSELVQYFPLALQQAIAYIIQQRKHIRTRKYSVSNYVEEFEVKKSQMLGQKLNKFEHEYSMTTSVTWDMTVDKLDKNAVDILDIVAHLQPDSIRLDLLERICVRRDLKDFDTGMDMIFNYSLVKIEGNIVSIHRLMQEVTRGKIQNTEEFCKALFDSVLLATWKFVEFALEHLESVYTFAWKGNPPFKFSWINAFHGILFFLLEHGRVVCAIEYTKLNFPNIKFNSEISEEGVREFLEKVVLWSIVNRDLNVTREMIETGLYSVSIVEYIVEYNKNKSENRKLLEIALELSKKYFNEKGKVTFAVKNGLVKTLYFDTEYDAALTLCEQLVNVFDGDVSQKKIFVQNIDFMLRELNEKIIKDWDKEITNSRLGRVGTIITRFSQIYPNDLEILELEAIVLDLKGDYQKSFELFTKIVPHLEQTEDAHKYKIKKYELKLIELKVKLTDFDVTGREEIEKEFSEADYDNFPLQLLDKISPIYEKILGSNHELTVKVKKAMAGICNNENCICLSEQVLHSSQDEKYEWVFGLLCISKNIYENYEEQKKILGPLLQNKLLELGENHSNTLRILKLLAKATEKCGELREALKMFEKVRNSAIDCRWDEKDLKYSRLDVARVKLRIGDFSNIKTSDDISREFGEFEKYRLELSFEELNRVCNLYKRVLGDSHKLTLIVINAMARILMRIKEDGSEKSNKSLELVEKVIGSGGDKDEIKNAYDTMEIIAINFHRDKNYEQSKELLDRVLKFRIQSQGDSHEDTIATKGYLDWVLYKL